MGSQVVWKLVSRRTAMQSPSKRDTLTPPKAVSTPWTSWHQPTVAPYLLACTLYSACCADSFEASASVNCAGDKNLPSNYGRALRLSELDLTLFWIAARSGLASIRPVTHAVVDSLQGLDSCAC